MSTAHLPESLDAWNSPGFGAALKREMERLGVAGLPLQQALTRTSHVLDEPCSVRVIGAAEADGAIRARVGVFFSGVVAGCSCADDPTPVEAVDEYCELDVVIDQATGSARFELDED